MDGSESINISVRQEDAVGKQIIQEMNRGAILRTLTVSFQSVESNRAIFNWTSKLVCVFFGFALLRSVNV